MADDYHSEFPYWSIYYDDEGYDIKGNRIMGRQAAGWSFLKALVKDDPKRISAYIKNKEQKELLINKVKIIAIGINSSMDSSLSKKILSIAGSSNQAVAPVQSAMITIKKSELNNLNEYGLMLSLNNLLSICVPVMKRYS